MSLNQIMNISREAMNNNQVALTVTSHNIANVNTEGYSRQRAEFQESILGNRMTGVSSLNGSVISKITSYASSTIGAAFMYNNSQYNYLAKLASVNTSLENISKEMGEKGLQKSLSDFFAAAQNLNLYPTDINARNNYLQSAQSIISKLNLISGNIDNTTQELIGNYLEPSTMKTSELGMSIEQINQRLERIGELNLQIAQNSSSTQGGANGLIDQRNALLDQISGFVPVKVSMNSNSTVNVSIGGALLVQGAKVTGTLEVTAGTADEPAVISIKDKDSKVVSGNINSELTSGSVGAILKAVGKSDDAYLSLSGMQSLLDTFANDFANAINQMQTYQNGTTKAMCLTTDPLTGEMVLTEATEPMFTGGPPITAKNLQLNDAIKKDPNLIATARVDTTNANWEKNVGNSDNILAIAELRNKNVVQTPGSLVVDCTADKFITNITGKLAVQGKDLQGKMDSQGSILDSISAERASVSGVNMDEELADMIRFQRAYEASARCFSAASDIFQILVNLGR